MTANTCGPIGNNDDSRLHFAPPPQTRRTTIAAATAATANAATAGPWPLGSPSPQWKHRGIARPDGDDQPTMTDERSWPRGPQGGLRWRGEVPAAVIRREV